MQENLIRQATLKDASAIVLLLESIPYLDRVRNAGAGFMLKQVERQLALCLESDSHSVFVAEQQGVKAFMSIHWLPYLLFRGAEGFISELFVHNDASGQGLGADLIKKARAEAVLRDCYRLRLTNMRGRASYERGFYRKQGFVEREDAAEFVMVLA